MNTEYIEEMIEESYLLGLSEPDIRANLDRFGGRNRRVCPLPPGRGGGTPKGLHETFVTDTRRDSDRMRLCADTEYGYQKPH